LALLVSAPPPGLTVRVSGMSRRAPRESAVRDGREHRDQRRPAHAMSIGARDAGERTGACRSPRGRRIVLTHQREHHRGDNSASVSLQMHAACCRGDAHPSHTALGRPCRLVVS
jgi:hypothetical protein